MHGPRSLRRWLARIAPVVGFALLLSACANAPQTALEPQGPFAERPDRLFRIVFWIAVVVFVLVQGLIVLAIVKFRERPGDDSMPVQVHGNTRLEILWTIVPALILAGIAVPTVQMIFELDAEPAGAVTVEVIGHRWWWEYRYPGTDVVTANELVIPAGTPVRLEMTAEEAGSAERGVVHSFWVPALAGKRDVVPGRINTLNIEANEPGTYLGQCAEYCGISHANMRLRVIALEPAEYQQWLDDQQQPARRPESGSLAARGEELFFGGACVECHAIRGVEVGGGTARSIVGPDLTHFATRSEFAGAIFDIDEENLSRWLADPPAMKPMRVLEFPGIGMPNLGLDPDEIEALVAYLMQLE